jgi:oligopeptide/dipeptide ABC transporter ATP-binding protein
MTQPKQAVTTLSTTKAVQPQDLLLDVHGLTTTITSRRGEFNAVQDVTFALHRQEKIALIGESGSGKSLTALSITGLLPQPVVRVTGGRVEFDGIDLVNSAPSTLRDLRGRRIGMLFQDPMTSLNPLLTIRKQLYEAVEAHLDWPWERIHERAAALLRRVRIDDPERVLRQYPYQLSGGMRQRVMLAMALMCSPDLIIADEPTTALDVTVQREVIALLRELADIERCAVIFISHDLNLVSEFADRILVMYAGRIVESGTAGQVYHRPCHPYAVDLVSSILRIDQPRREHLTTIAGQPPHLEALPSGCAYQPRCARAIAECAEEVPPLRGCSEAGHRAACVHVGRTTSP